MEQAFVKFFGNSETREDRSMSVLDEVKRAGCHWACTYPKGKRPRQVQHGAAIFMSQLVQNPSDIMIYGRAIGISHEPGRDDASAEDIQQRSWKEKWPHYIRVHRPEFIGGTLSNCISLNRMMDVLKSDSFASTQRNAAIGTGNTDPRKAYLQQPAMLLSAQATVWIIENLERAYAQYGKIAPAVLQQLDWPEVRIAGIA